MLVSLLHASDQFSVVNLFFNATFTIKIIMLGLVAGSIWSWAIIFHKTFVLWLVRKKLRYFEKHFRKSGSLEDLYDLAKADPQHPGAEMFLAAMQEWQYTMKGKTLLQDPRHTLERVERAMRVTMSREVDKLYDHLGFLSALGTNGVIIGLFGTVLGIMNSFQAIAQHQNTSLAIVAPGIAEALFATAIGLAAAIPAALFYNRFAFNIQSFESRLEDFIQNFVIIISRQVDEAA